MHVIAEVVGGCFKSCELFLWQLPSCGCAIRSFFTCWHLKICPSASIKCTWRCHMILTNKQTTYYPIPFSPSLPLSLHHFWRVGSFSFNNLSQTHSLQDSPFTSGGCLGDALDFCRPLFEHHIYLWHLMTIGIKNDTKTSLSLILSQRIHEWYFNLRLSQKIK